MASNPKARRSRFSKEVEEIRRMRDLNRILKTGDMENALLSNSAKDSETMNDNVLDTLLSNASMHRRGDDRDLEVIERLTTSISAGITRQKRVRVERSSRGVKMRRSLHMVKRARPRPKARRLKKRR